jgi:hypothetical protein
MPEKYDANNPQESLMSHCISESEKKDGSKNGGDGGHEYGEGPEIGCGPVHKNIIIKKTDITYYDQVFCPSRNFLTCALL